MKDTLPSPPKPAGPEATVNPAEKVEAGEKEKGKRKTDDKRETSTPQAQSPIKKLKGQPPKNGPNAIPAYMNKIIRQICEPKVNRVSKRIKETPTLRMEYSNKRPSSQDSSPSF